MHNPEFVLENEMYKVLWDLEIKTDHLIAARRPDLVIINKKKVYFTIHPDHRIELIESEKIDKYLELARELPAPQKKTQTKNKTNKQNLWNKNVTRIPIVIGALGTTPEGC